MKKLIFIFLLITGFSYAQQTVRVDLSNPNATIYTHLYFLGEDNYNVSKAALTIRGVPKKEAEDKVKKLKEIFDGKGLIADFKAIPTDPNFLDTISDDNELDRAMNKFVPFPKKLSKVYVVKIGSKWYYSEETVESIDKIYKDTFPWEFQWLKKTFPSLFEKEIKGVQLWKPIGVLLLILFSFLLYQILNKITFYLLNKTQQLIIKDDSDQESIKLLHQLSSIIVYLILIYAIEKVLPTLQLLVINNFLFLALNIIKTVFWIYFFIRLTKLVLLLYSDSTKGSQSKINEQLMPLLYKGFAGIIIFIGILNILILLGVNPTTVIAGASIGGVAIAFASQDLVKNLIGTLVIFLDEPFRIGDWVIIGGVEGAVERVGFRSTRVRGADTSIYQIPNNKISEMEVNNKGLRLYRRYTTTLGIKYDTPPVLIEAFVDGIRKIIVEHPDTRSDSYNVEFTGFGDSALLIMVNVFFKQLEWGAEQSSKHRLHIGIIKLAAALGVDFAFPTSTLVVEDFPGQVSLASKYNTDEKVINKSTQKVLIDFKESGHKSDSNISSIPSD